MSGRSDSDYGLAIAQLLQVRMHENEGIGWLSGWAQYVPSSGSFLPKVNLSLDGALCSCATVRNISFLTSVSGTECQGCQRAWRVLCIRPKGLESWKVLSKGKMLGISLVSIMLLEIADCRIQ